MDRGDLAHADVLLSQLTHLPLEQELHCEDNRIGARYLLTSHEVFVYHSNVAPHPVCLADMF